MSGDLKQEWIHELFSPFSEEAEGKLVRFILAHFMGQRCGAGGDRRAGGRIKAEAGTGQEAAPDPERPPSLRHEAPARHNKP